MKDTTSESGLIYIPVSGMVFYLGEIQRHIFWFLSVSSRVDINLREGREEATDTNSIHVVSIKLVHQKSLIEDIMSRKDVPVVGGEMLCKKKGTADSRKSLSR